MRDSRFLRISKHEIADALTITEIADALTAKGYTVRDAGDRIWINATPNGGRGSYGYIVAAADTRDMAAKITKRSGEICASLREICN